VPAGLTKGNGKVLSLTRKKINEVCAPSKKEEIELKFSLITVDIFPLSQIAEVLKENWEKTGFKVDIKKVSISSLETDILKQRNFEAILFGESLGSMIDPFPFWHSSQKDYPGLNISGYNSKKADSLLEKARQTRDPESKKKILEEFQEVLIKDLPAIFLVSSEYLYLLDYNIKGFNVKKITEPSKRFSTIENWYIKTRRVWR